MRGLFSRVAATLVLMLLTTATAWADDISVTYTFSYTSGALGANRHGHITRQDNTKLTTEWNHGTYGVLWPKNETHGVDDEYDITFTPNYELDSKEVNNVKSFATEKAKNSSAEGTTFTVAVGASGYYIKRVTFKNGNTNVATASNTAVANSSTLNVLVAPEKFFTQVVVELTDNYYGRVTPGSELSITSSPSLTYNNTDYYLAGSTVTLAPTDDNYIVTGVSGVNGATIATDKHSFSFTMPAEDVSPTATLAALSGSCGLGSEDCSWRMSDENGDGTYETLTISGTGRLNYFENGTAPWYDDFHSTITNLIIGDGISMILSSNFYGLTGITEVTLPASVYYIAQNAFEDCTSLARVNILKSDDVVILYASSAFSGCTALRYIVVPTPALAVEYSTAEQWCNHASKLRVALGNYLFPVTDEGGTVAYAITSETDLRHLSAYVNAGNDDATSGKTFRQTADIDLSSGGNFTPIGKQAYPSKSFKGSYDGGGYTISGLSISVDHAFAGLFGAVECGGMVKNVRLITPCVTSSHVEASVGTIAGCIMRTGTIENCCVFNPTVSATGSGNTYVGAICGYAYSTPNYYCTLTNVYYYNSSLKAIGRHDSSGYSKVTNCGRARKVTAGDGVTIAAPAATEGFTYGGDNYYREGLALTVSVSDPNKIITALSAGDAAYTLASDKKSATVTVPAADINVTATLKTLSGSCGTNVNWALTDEDGDGTYETLTISGTGAMKDYANEPSRGWHSDRTNITTVIICSGVESIGINAFKECSALTSIEIPNSVTSIGGSAFYGCSSLTSVTLPNRLTSIDIYAFSGCTALTSIEIPGSVTSIGACSFLDTHLASVTIYAPSLTEYASSVFLSNASGRKIYVFSDCVDTYKSGWFFDASDIEPITLAANEGAAGEYWTTYYNDMADAKAPEGTQVFKASLDGEKLTLTPIADGIITRGQAVVLKSTSATVQPDHSATASADDYSDNDLHGTMTRIENPGDVYVLNKGSQGVGFYKLSDTGHIGAHKAYLTYSGSALVRKFFGFSETTAIETDIETVAQPSASDNDGAWYTLSGVRLQDKPTKSGVYIHNGRKEAVK